MIIHFLTCDVIVVVCLCVCYVFFVIFFVLLRAARVIVCLDYYLKQPSKSDLNFIAFTSIPSISITEARISPP